MGAEHAYIPCAPKDNNGGIDNKTKRSKLKRPEKPEKEIRSSVVLTPGTSLPRSSSADTLANDYDSIEEDGFINIYSDLEKKQQKLKVFKNIEP